MGRIWALASILCLIAAAVLFVLGYMDATFVLAALGAVAWILDYRAQIRGKLPDDSLRQRQTADDFDESDEADYEDEEGETNEQDEK
jgi:hypothetical protein